MTFPNHLLKQIVREIGLISLFLGISLLNGVEVVHSQPATSPQPLQQVTGSSKDLTGITSPNGAEIWGAVGGENPYLKEETSPYQIQDSFYIKKTETINLTLETLETQLGDVQRPTRRFLLIY